MGPKNTKTLNIGCGKQHIDGINLDISSMCHPDVEYDIRDGLPFDDYAFEEVIANGVLEMVLTNEDFVFVLNEVHRVLAPKGIFRGQVPSIDPRVLMLDPFDRRWFKEETFDYWNANKHAWKEFGTQYGFKPWEVIKVETNENGIINFIMSPV